MLDTILDCIVSIVHSNPPAVHAMLVCMRSGGKGFAFVVEWRVVVAALFLYNIAIDHVGSSS